MPTTWTGEPLPAISLQKPAKGSTFIARKTATKAIKAAEEKLKDEIRALDNRRCRWPNCEHCRSFKPRLEVAHVQAKGQGGDHGERTTAGNLIVLDFLTHQGPDGLERHERFIEPLTELGTRGPCAFYVKQYSETKPGEWTWRCVGVERSPGVLDTSITERIITNEGEFMDTRDSVIDETTKEPAADPKTETTQPTAQGDGDHGSEKVAEDATE